MSLFIVDGNKDVVIERDVAGRHCDVVEPKRFEVGITAFFTLLLIDGAVVFEAPSVRLGLEEVVWLTTEALGLPFSLAMDSSISSSNF